MDLGGFSQSVHGQHPGGRVRLSVEISLPELMKQGIWEEPELLHALGIGDRLTLSMTFGRNAAIARDASKPNPSAFLPQPDQGKHLENVEDGIHLQEMHLSCDTIFEPLVEFRRTVGGDFRVFRLAPLQSTLYPLLKATNLPGIGRAKIRVAQEQMWNAVLETANYSWIPGKAKVGRNWTPVDTLFPSGPLLIDREYKPVADLVKRNPKDIRSTDFAGCRPISWRAMPLWPILQRNAMDSKEPGDTSLAVSVLLISVLRNLCWVSAEAVHRHVVGTYLGPLRWYPSQRTWTFGVAESLRSNQGAEAWDRVMANDNIRSKVNSWLKRLQTPYRIEVEELFKASEIQQWLKSAGTGSTSSYPNRFAKREAVLAALMASRQVGDRKYTEMRIRDLRSGVLVDHTDVGTGISQVLPVVVSGVAGTGTTLIEQPEMHLHPRLHAELADMFLGEALKAGKTPRSFVVETHSEHLALRVLRRIRQTATGELPPGMPQVNPDDVCFLYVHPRKDGSSVVLRIRVDEEGRFIDHWPDGFFPERLEELL